MDDGPWAWRDIRFCISSSSLTFHHGCMRVWNVCWWVDGGVVVVVVKEAWTKTAVNVSSLEKIAMWGRSKFSNCSFHLAVSSRVVKSATYSCLGLYPPVT